MDRGLGGPHPWGLCHGHLCDLGIACVMKIYNTFNMVNLGQGLMTVSPLFVVVLVFKSRLGSLLCGL